MSEVQISTGPAPGYVVPVGGGVITSWHSAGNGTDTGNLKLKVWTPTSDPMKWVVGGQSGTETQTPSGPNLYNTRVPVQGGERLGVYVVTSSPACIFTTAAGSDVILQGAADVANGETESFVLSPFSPWRVNVSAVVEPDTDHDGFGDETQDACPGLPGSVNGCPKADLALTKTATQGGESDLVTYTLVAKNNGPDPVPDAVVVDTLPVGATFVSSSGPGSPCSVGGRSVPCVVGALASGASSTRTITARLKAGSQTNAATISSAALTLAATRAAGAGDPNPANNTAIATVNVASPAVTQAGVSPQTFRLGSALPKITRRAPVGTTISFRLSEPATTTLAFSQPKTGRRVGRTCKPLTRANRRKRRCTIPNIRGTLTFNGHSGTNKIRFQGRLSRSKRLKPGRYTLTITATDSAGNRSSTKATSFTIVRG